MSQTSYSRNMTAGMMGLIADSEFTYKESPVAIENILFGLGCSYGDATEGTARLPKPTLSTILFDADFVASNTIDLDVNGTSIAQVTYATSHDNTADLLAAAIDALEGVNCELDSTDTNNRTFLVTTDDAAALVTSVTVAAGSTQAGSTVTAGTDDKFLGVAVQSHTEEQQSDGTVQYDANDCFPCIRKGKVWVYVEEAVDERSPVYLRHTANGATKIPGYFRTDADSAKAFLVQNANFRKRTSGAGLTILEINKP